jgi:hypothetical protein
MDADRAGHQERQLFLLRTQHLAAPVKQDRAQRIVVAPTLELTAHGGRATAQLTCQHLRKDAEVKLDHPLFLRGEQGRAGQHGGQ